MFEAVLERRIQGGESVEIKDSGGPQDVPDRKRVRDVFGG